MCLLLDPNNFVVDRVSTVVVNEDEVYLLSTISISNDDLVFANAARSFDRYSSHLSYLTSQVLLIT